MPTKLLLCLEVRGFLYPIPKRLFKMLNDIFLYKLIKCHYLHPPVWSAVRVVFRVGSPRSSPCSAASSFPPFCAAEQD